MTGYRFRTLYDPIEPYETGRLAVHGGHELYFERCGKPGGTPAVFLHGGPGGAISPEHRRLFDPARYDVLLFDQRGCGNSIPHASVENNTTWQLVNDIERLRAHIGVGRWLVFGGSWGATLALAYAQQYVSSVSGLVLRGVFLMRRSEIEWFYKFGASAVFPEAWHEFESAVPVGERGDLLSAYQARLFSADPEMCLSAARAWAKWEGSALRLVPDAADVATFEDAKFALAFARLENHFFINGGWLQEGQLLSDAVRLRDVPGVIVQGRYDMVCPPRSAWDLKEVWPDADLQIVEAAGHAWTEPGILDALIRATDRFA